MKQSPEQYGRFSFFTASAEGLPLESQDVTGLLLVDIRDLFTLDEKVNKESNAIDIETVLSPYLKDFFIKLDKIDHTHIHCKFLVHEQYLEMGEFPKYISEYRRAYGQQNMVDDALSSLWKNFFDADPYIIFTSNESGEFIVPDFTKQFPNVCEENIVLLSSDNCLRDAVKNSDLIHIKPYRTGEISQLHLEDLTENFKLPENRASKKIVWLDLDDSILMCTATLYENKTILNSHVIELLKNIFPDPSESDIRFITARAWRSAEDDPDHITSVAAIKRLLETDNFNITEVIHTDFRLHNRRKVEFILDHLEASPGIHIFIEDNANELCTALENQSKFSEKNSCLLPVLVATDGMLPLDFFQNVSDMFARSIPKPVCVSNAVTSVVVV